MKTVGWLGGIGTLAAGGAYMLVSLYRWEWNRALFFGLIVVIAEIALATALVLRKLGQISASLDERDPTVTEAIRDARPPARDRFAWLKDTTKGQLNVFITFLVGGGVLLSAIAWIVDHIALATTTPLREQRLAERLDAIAYPAGGLLGDDRALVQLLRRPR
jgi:hypothetical protein